MPKTEETLLQQAKAGSRRAFGKLVEIHQDKLLYLAYDLMGNWEDAKDAAQESFIRAFQKLDRFEGKSQFSSWLYRITVNLCMDIHRKKNRRPTDAMETTSAELIQAGLEKHENLSITPLEFNELKTQIDDALTLLSINQRTAVVLKFFHELSPRQISEIMDCGENTVRIHLFRAMKKLKETLKEVA